MASTSELDAISKDLDALRRDVATLAGSLASRSSDGVRHYANRYARHGAARAGAALDYAAANGADLLEGAGSHARYAADEVAAQVRRHPAVALAGLLTIGMLAYLAACRK
ncbi:hypothetical protein EV667_2873 [Ancylobacter aquaticus]|uniref:DUF883 family protein n=1 Tax=Ancylobacter aquaticus TaxID=100 RepID=A0A4R1I7W1_ANCAQ|nr:hypothetical protein [Ancylobacter aquaticus]TCK28859.1 hypothetical protein EV667_2873 [Ancylobacter aquaticus]